jgi:hypothetical protein
MIRPSGVATLAIVIVSSIVIGTMLVQRAIADLSGLSPSLSWADFGFEHVGRDRITWRGFTWEFGGRQRVIEDLADCDGAIGIEITGLSAAWRARTGVPETLVGAVISEVLPGSPAENAGLRVGDVIVVADTTAVTNACSVGFAFGRTCQTFELTVYRGPEVQRVKVTPLPQVALYEQACKAGAQSTCYRLAWLTWHGSGVPRDEERALRMYEEACARDSGAACGELGRLLSAREDRRHEALGRLEQACDLNDPQGCLLYASAVAMGTLADRDDAHSVPKFEKACALGSALGCYNTGLMYNEGRGVPVDHERAFLAHAEGCALGSTTACTDEGFMRQHGRGVAKDEALAAMLYERACADTACQAANRLGCLNLGNVYRDGVGVRADPARAAQIFRSACEQEPDPTDVDPGRARARACSLLGALYLVGNGVETDPVQGLGFSARGCDQDDGYGCFNAGVVYSRGLGVAPNEDRAMVFFRRACGAGDEEACTYVLRKLPPAPDAADLRGGASKQQ